MLITQASPAIYPQPTTSSPPPAPELTALETTEPAAMGGSRGLALLSGDAAAVVIAEQEAPATAAKAGLDLRGRDLRDVDLSAMDLRGANLSDADLSGKDLSGLDLSGATLTNVKADGANLTDTKLNAVNATGASFTGALFVRTGLNNADFAGAKFNEAYFGGTKDSPDLTGDEIRLQGKNTVVVSSNFVGADFSGATAKYSLTFQASNLDNASFDGAKSPGWTGPAAGSGIGFNNSTARNASFRGVSADIGAWESDFSGSNFTKMSDNVVDIRGSKIDNTSFAGSSSTLKFVRLDLRTVDLSVKNKDMSNGIFVDNNMAGKDFSGYDFSGSLFQITGSRMESRFYSGQAASLDDAVTGTNFSGATFTGATFHDFDMRKALVDAGALDGAEQHVGYSDSRYSQYGDLFKNVQSSMEAARVLYARS